MWLLPQPSTVRGLRLNHCKHDIHHARFSMHLCVAIGPMHIRVLGLSDPCIPRSSHESVALGLG